ncbi:SusC/RagA family TonB-linked outer membrane protein [Ferruginibacter albus]|uniref:SusC/RagA family TonB-linked outer membrane protein n=1 Tax=Ferruginibacter albus TaxID=2875540 RepID=UPI001CC59170|nr:SusC/RagA family TonB-linked outer membrane protein [Ferruginibacter albus]UAY51609.1 SusC/RagA family TonB-linked outer membrane protein [Ferruginibacter albus]
MNVKRLLLLTIVWLAGISYSMAQNKTVSGKVTDSKTGAPLSNVTVSVKGTKLAAPTAADGSFSIANVPATATSLTITSVGYTAQTVPIGAGALNISLVAVSSSLDEVVVIGYGSQKKKEVTGAISKVTSEQINSAPVQSIEASLQGKAPGVQVITGNGLAGSGSVVRIRGTASLASSGDPLYVLDGIPIFNDNFVVGASNGANENPLASINPNDIESIEILKDAGATGIYGSRGANGVILITTKRGKSGKLTFTYSNKWGLDTYTEKPDFVDGPEWLQLRQEAWVNSGNTGYAPLPNGVSLSKAQTTNTDWWDLVTRTGIINEHNLSMNVGGKKLKAFANFTYGKDEGYIVNNSYTRVSGRFNLDYTASKKLKISLTSGYNNGINEQQQGTLIKAMSSALPIYSVYDSVGVYTSATSNPVRDQARQQQREYARRLTGGLTVEFQPIKNLILKGVGSIEDINTVNYYFKDNKYNHGENTLFPVDSGYTSGSPYFGDNWTATFTATYNLNIKDKHKFTFLVGNEEQEAKIYNYVGTISQSSSQPYWEIPSAYEARKADLLANGGIVKQGVPYDSWTFNSFFGRLNYSLLSKYLLQVTLREDGSSKFGQNSRHGFFPAVSAAWIISDEAFLKNSRSINFLKLRASYGEVGNSNYPAGRYYPDYRAGGVPYLGNATLYNNAPGNPDLHWEKLKNADVALEYGLFNNRLTGEIAYYHKLSSDILFYVGTQTSTGFNGGWRNLNGSQIKNEGLEFSADFKIINTKNIKWTVGGNIAKNDNRVLAFPVSPDVTSAASFNDTRLQVGYPIGINYLVRYYGVDPADGLPIWLDQNGKQTKTYSLDYRVPDGSVQPDYYGGFNSSFAYKNFSVSTLFTYVIGGNIYDGSGKEQFAGVSFNNWDNFRTDFTDRWTKPGDIAKYPKLVDDITEYPGVVSKYQFNSTMFLHDGSYIRMKQITFAYRIPKAVLLRSFIKDASVSVSANNLLTFSKYPNGDPEVIRDFQGQGGADNNDIDKNLSPNVAYYTTPAQKSFIISLNVTF